MRGSARAHANIALAKYWGKRPVPGNIPATPSVSITLDALTTETSVHFDPSLDHDVFELGGVVATGRPYDRVVRVLDELRALAGVQRRARVSSQNGFPTASGLASSASGFAALVVAAGAALGLALTTAESSRVARRASASAARSLPGGFVALGTEDDAAAEPIAEAAHWDLRVLVLAVTESAKEVASTTGMNHTAATSPFFTAWLEDAPKMAREIRRAVIARDFEALAAASEASALRMHASAMAASPGVVYFQPATLALFHTVRALRARGVAVFATMDAGPHVKAVCTPGEVPALLAELAPFAIRTLVSQVGGPAVQT